MNRPIWQISAGPANRSYADVFLSYGVGLIGPGDSGQTNTPREVVEAALAHTVRNPTEAAYARSDLFERRRRLMDEWASAIEMM